MRYETEHEGRKVGLAMECEYCDGTGTIVFAPDIEDVSWYDCPDCHNGKRFLTVEEVKEFKMEKRGIPFSEVIRCVMLDGSTVTYKGKPVTVEAI